MSVCLCEDVCVCENESVSVLLLCLYFLHPQLLTIHGRIALKTLAACLLVLHIPRHARATKATGPTARLTEGLHFHHIRHADALEDELCDTVALLHFKGLRAVVEEDDAHRPTVVIVDHTRTDINELLPGKAGARGCVLFLVGDVCG